MTLLPVADAKSRILAGVAPTGLDQVALDAAHGRVLAQDVSARINQPPFDASAMDGYAVRANDIYTVPVDLTVIGDAPAGSSFDGLVGKGQAVRIFTGAPVPKGADTIVIQENTVTQGAVVTVLETASSGRFVRPCGLDFKHGEVLLQKGKRLGSREVALAAAMNHPALPVHRKPVVAILPTGDELVIPGGAPRPEQIISSNNYGIAAFVRHFGGEPLDLGVTGDSKEALQHALERAAGADILVTLGGASVGAHDLVQQALVDFGMTLDFWKIAMRPGKPLIFGKLGDMRVLGFPGNPVSAFVCAAVFLRPLLDVMLGSTGDDTTLKAKLGVRVDANDERQDYQRATLGRDDAGCYIATPFTKQDSSMLRTLAQAQCMVVRPPHDPSRKAGEFIEILLLDF